ncbi:MAG: hypothetical protein AAFQ02_10115 [Bacteroidota bacterium]
MITISTFRCARIVALLAVIPWMINAQNVQMYVEAVDGDSFGIGYLADGEGSGFYADSMDTHGFYSDEAARAGFYSNLSQRDGFFEAGSVRHGYSSLSAGEHGFVTTNAGLNGFQSFNANEDGFHSSGAEQDGFHSLNAGSYGFRSQSATRTGFYSLNDKEYGFRSQNAALNGFHSENAGGNGYWSSSATLHGYFSINSTRDGFRSENAMGNGISSSNAADDGVQSSGAGARAGFFTNDQNSTNACVFIAHGDNEQQDILLGETGRISAQKSVVIKLDLDDNEASKFIVRSSSNADVLTLLENGNLSVTGSLSKGSGTFKIDHPLYPTQKYLYHSFVESPDMMNIYNGNVITDESGKAVVTLPDYFESLNMDFRYQLTVIGTFAQAIVSEEVSDNSFVIETSEPEVKVSWQVTGIRQDPYAQFHRVEVEVDKEPEEIGSYLHPEAYGKSASSNDQQ